MAEAARSRVEAERVVRAAPGRGGVALSLTAGAALSGAIPPPECTTQHDIIWPVGSLGPSPTPIDADEDQLLDEAEHELALCAMPKYLYDSAENARLPDEPAILYSIYPIGFYQGRVKLEIRYVELHAQDGGFFSCGGVACPGSGCDSHLGDSTRKTVQLLVRSRRKAEIFAPPPNTTFDGTHEVVYLTAGKHHNFKTPRVCGHCDNSCCYEDGCFNQDRGNGLGAAVIPSVAVHNVGQEEFFPFATFPQTTPKLVSVRRITSQTAIGRRAT